MAASGLTPHNVTFATDDHDDDDGSEITSSQESDVAANGFVCV